MMEKDSSFLLDLSKELKEFESFLKHYIENHFIKQKEVGLKKLKDSVCYTLFSEGKRFRPALSISVCKAIGIPYKDCFPLAAALELIHTASLIHDDLPIMDDDKTRRGKPSNHIVFQEDMALLSGDSLLIEPFYLLAHYKQKTELIQIVAEAASARGMIGGQALDLNFQPESLEKIYEMKTGALIRASIMGCLTLASTPHHKALTRYAYYLGQSFQLADDIEDFQSKEKSNISAMMNHKQALKKLEEWTQISLDSIKNIETKLLEKAVLFNQKRVQV